MPVTKLHGKNGAISVGGVVVANKAEWTLQRNRDYVDATTFGDPNKTYLAGLPNVQGTYAGLLLFNDATVSDPLLTAATLDSQTIVLYASYPGTGVASSAATIQVATGPGFIDASVNCSNTDAVRITGEFRASGAWEIS